MRALLHWQIWVADAAAWSAVKDPAAFGQENQLFSVMESTRTVGIFWRVPRQCAAQTVAQPGRKNNLASEPCEMGRCLLALSGNPFLRIALSSSGPDPLLSVLALKLSRQWLQWQLTINDSIPRRSSGVAASSSAAKAAAAPPSSTISHKIETLRGPPRT